MAFGASKTPRRVVLLGVSQNLTFFSKLDYWLISNSLTDNVCTVDILIPSIKTDHSTISLEFQDVEDRFRGPGIWKLNCSLLSDEEYVERINSLIPTWVEEGKKDLKDPRSV